ncbi:hypothetical protein ACH5RR_020845 [Cinchona calisaya]|uniref:Uncharacterized protein n=1 Tax=Cinchona calisaya TaxID=153742 RepID=A0ABD2ZFK9_9GENT
MVQEEIRRGPWTEQEDVQLVLCVNVYGDRRWDFIAKVSGLKRTGKSCRLRWVNYLHPGLKRGKMTPHEERLVIELQSKWGNRWSRIARKLPGRTDNEIKNYWRTHLRKTAQERKKAATSPSSSTSSFSNCSSSVSNGNSPTVESVPISETKERSFYDTGGLGMLTAARGNKTSQEEEAMSQKVYSMDEIWKDIEFSEDDVIQPIYDGYGEGGCNFSSQTMASPVWDDHPVSLWMMDDEETKMFPPISNQFYSFYNQESTIFAG